MGSVDRIDDRTFNVGFSADGMAKLREVVKEKLMEFMDFSDDHLVEYVIVLVKNGKRKEEARNELHVFLDDDTDSFVSWLWDHLASSVDLYVQPQDSSVDESPETKAMEIEQYEKKESYHLNSESEREKHSKISRSRHNREWKGLVRDAVEAPPLRSSDIGKIHLEEKPHRKDSRAKRSPPAQPLAQRKRNRLEENENKKREAISLANVDAPRRLLQFAVRDAVATSRPSNSEKEPKLKRLRSVVSTSTGDISLVDRPQRTKCVSRVPNPMATVIRAVAEAADDVMKVKPSSGSVFDRLGRGLDVSEIRSQDVQFRGAAVENGEYGDVSKIQLQTMSRNHQTSDYSGQYAGNMGLLEGETGLASDSASDNEGYDAVNVVGHRVMDVSQTAYSAGNRVEDSLMLQYGVAKNVDDVIQRTKNQEQPVVAANTSRNKIVNISVNVNNWKPPHYQEHRVVAEIDNRKPLQGSDAGYGNTGVRLVKEKSNPTVGNAKAKLAAEAQKTSQQTQSSTPGLYAAGRPLEDADSRTIFVSNVHFAATKDSLSRHFNKFGEVLKVVIVTDATTGQPKGSAYVEFMRKEAADNALSLDGTSFMSRILKVSFIEAGFSLVARNDNFLAFSAGVFVALISFHFPVCSCFCSCILSKTTIMATNKISCQVV